MKRSSETNKAYRDRFPLKKRAHMVIANEVRQGRLSALPCEKCGAEKTHAHHEDYTKPLDIIWLCQPCHVQRHIELAEEDPATWGQPNRRIGPPTARARSKRKDSHRPRPADWTKYQPAPKRDALKARAQELLNDGLSYQEIANEIGAAKGTVYKWLNKVSYQ